MKISPYMAPLWQHVSVSVKNFSLLFHESILNGLFIYLLIHLVTTLIRFLTGQL